MFIMIHLNSYILFLFLFLFLFIIQEIEEIE